MGPLNWITRREKRPGLNHGSFYRYWSERQASYDKLETWLRTCAATAIDTPQASPKGSYFASSPAGGVTWNGLPESFKLLFNPQQSGRVPTLVALGINDTWFALWPDSSSSCNLGDDYPDLETLLRKYGKGGVDVREHNITLSASQANQFTIAFRNKRCFIRGPVSEVQLHQLNNIMASSSEGSMQVQVCGLHTVSPPIVLPQPILNVQKVRFPGSPSDRTGKQFEVLGKSEGSNVAGFVSKISSSCIVM